MKKIAIIGGGIIGMTLANYLDTQQFEITLYDDGIGQATKASAGIISPWLSKRRNKKWYQLAKDGAVFFPKLVKDFELGTSVYNQTGTVIFRKDDELDALYDFAQQRLIDTPEMGSIERLSEEETTAALPLLKPRKALKISGGGKLDGLAYLEKLAQLAKGKGIRLINKKVELRQLDNKLVILDNGNSEIFDIVFVTAGPAIKNLLAPLGYNVDIRPQKGQLLEFETTHLESHDWPVVMLDGEADFIPFEQGKILIGATHENEGEWDLTPTQAAYDQLWSHAKEFLIEPYSFQKSPFNYRVGTRAYTSDFAPFFGEVEPKSNLLVASGLGSSGLTVGPLIGYLLAQKVNHGIWQTEHYQKPIESYIKKQGL